MATDGWVKWFRAAFTHPLFSGDVACRGWAFADLVGMAEYDDARRGFGGHVVELERGELVTSIRYLATRWRWSKSKVDRYLKRLEVEGMVKFRRSETGPHSGTPIGSVYLIVNYDTYQGDREAVRDTKRDSSGTSAGQIERSKEPTTTPEGASAETETAKAEMWADFNARAAGVSGLDREKAEALVRGIIDGDTYKAWETATGARVPWEERPRLFRLAMDERKASGGKIFHVLRQVVIPREFDPFKQTKSTDARPTRKAEPEAAVNQPAPTQHTLNELDRLRADHPEIYAEELASFERTTWWAERSAEDQAKDLKLAIRDRLKLRVA